MKKIKLFLASSEELKSDREQLEIFINRKNNQGVDIGVYIHLLIWEDFLDAMSQTRLQDEYNKAIRDCDIFVMLFFTKVGKYTNEEFETAFGQFQKTNKPIIYTYFKDATVSTGNMNRKDMTSLFAFQEKLEALGHFYSSYTNIADLKLQLTQQFDKLKGTLTLKSAEKKPRLSGELNQLSNLIEQGETTKSLLELRSIIISKLKNITKKSGLDQTKEPPMHMLRLLATNQIISKESLVPLEYSLTVIDKSLHDIRVDKKEAIDALTKTDEAFRILDSEKSKSAAITTSAKFILKRDRSGRFRYGLEAAGGDIILTSEAYNSKAALENGIESVRKNAKQDYRFDRRTAKNGRYYFNLKASNGQVIGSSTIYNNTESMEIGIILVKQNAPFAQIVDQITPNGC